MADSDRTTMARLTFAQAVEASSLWTAGSFVISGFANAGLFWLTFRMNYFTIATPTDIVMSGFLYVSVIAFIAFVLFGIIYFGSMTTWRAFFIAFTMVSASIAVEFDPKSGPIKPKQLAAWAVKAANLSAVIATLLGFAAANILTVPSVRNYLGLKPKPIPEYWDRSLMSDPSSHLYLASDDDNALKCGIAPVVWMGSSTVLLNCRGRLRVIHNTENLSLERHPPKDRAILDILQRPLPYLPKPPKLAEGDVQR